MFQISGISRLRIHIDGEGVRTLVVVQGCSLQCKYCINPQTWQTQERMRSISVSDLYDEIILDRPYFMATHGGVTFGGGEPLLFAKQIVAFKELCRGQFSIFAETSLNVPAKNVEMASTCIDQFIVDIKAVDKEKYQEYTGGSFSIAFENLKLLLSFIGNERVTVRIPIIPGFTTQKDQYRYRDMLRDIGVTRFDLFTYKI